jgi:microsomal dipeptidase-like Zn-dependent dipeptidase
MSKEIFTIDLHCHPNLKAFNSGFPTPVHNMWDKIQHKINGSFGETIKNISQHVLKESQTNLDALSAGNVRVFQVSLYPCERGFMHLRNIPKALLGSRRINIFQEVVTGYDVSCIVEMKRHADYFHDVEQEYAFVFGQQGKSPDGKSEFVLVNNYTELEQALKRKNALIGIITIEGAHVLGTGSAETDSLNEAELKHRLTENIEAIKRWEYPPFMINLAHHFWNHLSGHATSFKRPINGLVNQNRGKNKGITEAGWHVVRTLLSRENGKRILVDTKHMSLAARKEYYAFINNYNSINPDDTIPIVSSHAGVNGYATMDASIKETDDMAKSRTHRFWRWSINISNEEARIIHKSGGLIGLMMDRGMLGGVEVVKKIAAMTDGEKQRAEYSRLFWDNAFQVVKAIDNETGWDVLAIGTDFDGTITHMDPYESSAKFPLFQQDLINYLEEHKYQKELWYGYSPTELVEKIMNGNAMRFYKRFFV